MLPESLNSTELSNRNRILDQKIGDIAARDPRKADIFIKYQLDFCCNGNQTLKHAISKANIDADLIKKELQSLNDADILPSRNMAFWNVDFLCDFVVQTHHKYVRDTTQMLREYGEIVVNNHKANHPELFGIQEVLEMILDELQTHMDKEEQEIFPAIKQLRLMYFHPEKIDIKNKSIEKVNENFADLENEHMTVWHQYAALRKMSANYTPPKDACVTYQIYYTKLKEFEEDLINHVHIENNILFPKVKALAAKFE